MVLLGSRTNKNLGIAFAFANLTSSLSVSASLCSMTFGCSEQQGLSENIFHKTILKAETAQVRKTVCALHIGIRDGIQAL